ncbi:MULTISPECIES: hypothetical protein [unclassified Sphingomonas]|uniref:hypothetical protein n=1 Tax=unclassified Sphingomonas TaxID=196159 RepID=UPI002269AC9A|nr:MULTISPECIES: hypothetical protein [unclassified Sphingomonas]
MADDSLKPMQDGDAIPPPANTDFEPAAPLKDAGAAFSAEGGTLGDKTAGARQTRTDGAGKLQQQAYDKVRLFAEDGKGKVSGALDQLVQMLTDAATTVDEKLGEQYGQYARTAAETVSGYSEQVKGKDVDALFDDARGYVRQSPAVAVGVAAAVGFVAARLIQSGIEAGADAAKS